MSQFFTRERFGQPQFVAGVLLLAFLGQCVWLVSKSHPGSEVDVRTVFRVEQGLHIWRGEPALPSAVQSKTDFGPGSGSLTADGYDPNHSHLWYLIGSAPLLLWSHPLQLEGLGAWGWLARIPYLLFGLLLGASLWYVARRLYGNSGGYLALSLYCFSPRIIQSSALWFSQPEMGAAWGAFGAVFTAIAVAHTLYAPREVVLWNWRRIVLLGLSFAMAVGNMFSLLIVVPAALAFMLYLAPARRAAAVAIWGAACAVALLLLYASYAFHPGAFLAGLRHASFFPLLPKAYAMSGAYRDVVVEIGQTNPALLVGAPAALIVYSLWKRARYFGNTAPLLVAGLFLALAVGTPHYPGLGFQLMAVPFLFVFVAGVSADLLETRYSGLVMSCVLGLVAANAAWNLMGLVRI